MNRSYRTCVFAALAACLAVQAAAQQAQKRLKDQGESDLYTAAAKALEANDFPKALEGLEAWKAKYPDSELKDDRQFLISQAHLGAKQPGKAVDAVAGLLANDPVASLGPVNALKLLYATATAIHQLPEATPEQIAAVERAGKLLVDYDKRPEGVTEEAWTTARNQLQTAAKASLLYAAVLPATQAMAKQDCAAAETQAMKAVQAWPESVQAAWYLGTAQLCLYKKQPEKASPALYQLARAAAIDPSKGMVDAKWQKETVEPYLSKVYTQYHGADPEGLKSLKEIAVKSPQPPADFKVKSVTEIAAEKEAEFQKTNPQLALWMRIKAALADRDGEQYFAASLKDAAVPRMKGVLLEARPACRPTELLVAVPLPEATAQVAEISLKLDKPLAGAPALKTELQWEGVPSAFTSAPFLLTMATPAASLEGVTVSRCVAAPPKKAPAKRPAAKKKQGGRGRLPNQPEEDVAGRARSNSRGHSPIQAEPLVVKACGQTILYPAVVNGGSQDQGSQEPPEGVFHGASGSKQAACHVARTRTPLV